MNSHLTEILARERAVELRRAAEAASAVADGHSPATNGHHLRVVARVVFGRRHRIRSAASAQARVCAEESAH